MLFLIKSSCRTYIQIATPLAVVVATFSYDDSDDDSIVESDDDSYDELIGDREFWSWIVLFLRVLCSHFHRNVALKLKSLSEGYYSLTEYYSPLTDSPNFCSCSLTMITIGLYSSETKRQSTTSVSFYRCTIHRSHRTDRRDRTDRTNDLSFSCSYLSISRHSYVVLCGTFHMSYQSFRRHTLSSASLISSCVA